MSIIVVGTNHRASRILHRRPRASPATRHSHPRTAKGYRTFDTCLGKLFSSDEAVMLTRKPSAGACVRLSLSAALFVGAGACAKTPPQSLPATGSVTVGVTSRGPGVENMAFGVSIEPGG